MVQLRNDDSVLIFTSINYATNVLAQAAVEQLVTFGLLKNHYEVIKETGVFRARLVDDSGAVLGWISGDFDLKAQAYDATDELYEFIHEKFSGEGIYLIEHILLRPKRREIPAIPTPLSDITLNGIETPLGNYISPYSFAVTIILPSGLTNEITPVAERPERFGDEDFRVLAEKIIRREIPSHIKPAIFWLDSTGIDQFEVVYQPWLEGLADPATTEQQLVNTHNALIEQLQIIIDNG